MGHRVRLPMASLVYQLSVWTSALNHANLSNPSVRGPALPTPVYRLSGELVVFDFIYFLLLLCWFYNS